jgi:hypothetical protein
VPVHRLRLQRRVRPAHSGRQLRFAREPDERLRLAAELALHARGCSAGVSCKNNILCGVARLEGAFALIQAEPRSLGADDMANRLEWLNAITDDLEHREERHGQKCTRNAPQEMPEEQ